jgi:hypothetical protein
MSKVKELERLKINIAASTYLCDQDEGDLYDAYMVLMDETEKGNGKYTANSYVTIWQHLKHKTVDEILDLIDSNVHEPEVPEYIKKIDWAKLREQKDDILSIIGHEMVTGEYVESLEDVLSLLDAIQDYAVDSLGIDEDLVFNINPDENDK